MSTWSSFGITTYLYTLVGRTAVLYGTALLAAWIAARLALRRRVLRDGSMWFVTWRPWIACSLLALLVSAWIVVWFDRSQAERAMELPAPWTTRSNRSWTDLFAGSGLFVRLRAPGTPEHAAEEARAWLDRRGPWDVAIELARPELAAAPLDAPRPQVRELHALGAESWAAARLLAEPQSFRVLYRSRRPPGGNILVEGLTVRVMAAENGSAIDVWQYRIGDL